ncbi:porin-like protein [Alteromonadaceae bacterium 2753L.S.0a.02]|nr:porin-like protein [Alteromonadaceae bacterium 2753L.S.0a.02]
MNKKILPALIAMSLSTAAYADPEIWGLMHVTVHNADESSDSGTTSTSNVELVSNYSRLGFRGSEALENGMEVIYHYELGINTDDGTDWTKRNSFLGLKGEFGKIIAGRFDTAFKSSQGKVDIFGDQVGDIARMITVNDSRVNNTIAYTTPSTLGGFAVTGQYILSEDEDVKDGVTASASYAGNGLYAAVAAESNVKGEDSSAVRATVTYKFSKFQLGILGEQFKPNEDADSVNGGIVSAMFTPIEKLDIKVQYGTSDIVEEGGTSASFGVDYRMTKTFKWTSYLTQNKSDEGTENTYIGAGALLKF